MMDLLCLTVLVFGSKCSSSTASHTQNRQLEPELGLKTLSLPSLSYPEHNPSCISRSDLISSSAPLSVASLVDPKKMIKVRKSSERREFPPPIPLLARTGDLLCHMPWVLKKSYKDGRLIISEVPVKHHEYFRAHRGDGRLVLELIHMNDNQDTDCMSRDANVVDDDDKDVEAQEEQQTPNQVLRSLSESIELASSMPEGKVGYFGSYKPVPFFKTPVPKARPVRS